MELGEEIARSSLASKLVLYNRSVYDKIIFFYFKSEMDNFQKLASNYLASGICFQTVCKYSYI